MNKKTENLGRPMAESKTRTILNVRHLTLVGLMTAVTCVLGPLAIPVGPVPISLGTLAIYLTVTVLGMKLGTLSVVTYILLGLVGLPVFTNFSAGPGKLFGPTGGYIIGYTFLALICGAFVERFFHKPVLCFLGMVLGTGILYAFGTVWLKVQMNLTFFEALMAGVIPFIPGDLAKIVLAMTGGLQIRKRLVRAGFFPAGGKP